MPHPWKSWRPGWMSFWAMSCHGKCPCSQHLRGWHWMIFKDSFQLKLFCISIWFHDYKTLSNSIWFVASDMMIWYILKMKPHHTVYILVVKEVMLKMMNTDVISVCCNKEQLVEHLLCYKSFLESVHSAISNKDISKLNISQIFSVWLRWEFS